MEPQVKLVLWNLVWTGIKSELTDPYSIKEILLILSGLSFPVLSFLIIKFLWPWIIGKYRIKF